MVQILTILFSLVVIAVAFFSPLWGWILIAIPILLLLMTLWALKKGKPKYVPELSPEANTMLQRFWHFYNMPFASRDYSATASTLMFVGAALTIVGLFRQFWWGIALGLVNWFGMAHVARGFNPSNLLTENGRKVHAEIMAWINRKLDLKTGEDKPG